MFKSSPNLRLQLVRYKDVIKTLSEVANSIANFSVTKSKFSLVNGVFLGLEGLLNLKSSDPQNFFSASNGWFPLTEHTPIHGLFSSCIAKLEGKRLPFDYDDVKLFTTSAGQFVMIRDRYTPNSVTILCESKNRTQILNFLGERKIQELNSKFFTLDEITNDHSAQQLLLTPLPLYSIKSPRAEHIVGETEKAFKVGINRSVMLYGLPGTGKTTLSHTLVSHFGLRTLKLHPSGSLKLPYFLELLEALQIEALILDDFDQVEPDEKILEFLEIVNSRLKLVIGISNVLEGFDPAILRPGRFDEIIKVEEVEEITVREILGNLFDTYCNKVKTWPIAYIKELKKQEMLNPDKLEEKFKDLSQRVTELREAYCSEPVKEEQESEK